MSRLLIPKSCVMANSRKITTNAGGTVLCPRNAVKGFEPFHSAAVPTAVKVTARAS